MVGRICADAIRHVLLRSLAGMRAMLYVAAAREDITDANRATWSDLPA